MHGIFSERTRAPIEEKFALAIRSALAEKLQGAHSEILDEYAIRRAARALTTIEMTEALIDEHGVDEVSEKVMKLYYAESNQLPRWLNALGMTPSARAKLGVDVARSFDLIEALERRRATKAPPPTSLCDRCGDGKPKFRNPKTHERICRECAGR
ncbi:MAG: hypothetical protein KY429_08890 [Actinobacteria bacterium]|nr:hypothetical protein [Actinomycetota bacterium]